MGTTGTTPVLAPFYITMTISEKRFPRIPAGERGEYEKRVMDEDVAQAGWQYKRTDDGEGSGG